MSLKDDIKEAMKQAMRDKASARLDSLRMLTAAIQRREVDERIQLDDPQTLAIVEKLIKQGKEAIEQYEKGGRPELADKEKADIAIYQSFLPQQLSAGEVDAIINEAVTATGAASIKDMGKVMGVVKPKLQGRADMGQVSARIKARLGG
ncbi:MAG: glutamyl-tRNA amidotransferase [Candidatus Muproteobacteria bacterium RBG_16_62_13]|uniref:Glutamyl-tRNA amidotransferase n=1 Tax=Candidatus Muproteobacteria bacterium RBG_16_62_13 TaxID=1817756 RepID=A0A1F6T435_9PROT|nr:MAG: glutamyl-tRNA amidotransferase [Candidatus Muproteobacteria bacterium RBG_16_62_13]